MKKINFYFTTFLLSFLLNCSLSKNNYPFVIKHGGKWITSENNNNISISLDPTTSSFKGNLNCSKIEGSYFLDPKKIKFFDIKSKKIKNCSSNEKIKKEEKNFIKLLEEAQSHQLDSSNFKLYKGKLLLIDLKREK